MCFGQNGLKRLLSTSRQDGTAWIILWGLDTLHITSINTFLEETLQFSDQAKYTAPRLYDLSLNLQKSVFFSKRNHSFTKQYSSLSVQSEQTTGSTNWQVLVFLLIEDLGHVWDGTLGIPLSTICACQMLPLPSDLKCSFPLPHGSCRNLLCPSTGQSLTSNGCNCITVCPFKSG